MRHLCFLVGSVAISGGTYVIFQHACYLQEQGFKVTLAVQEAFTATSYSWHPQADSLNLVDFETAKTDSYDLVIGTWWKTALTLAEFKAPRYAYFVQSIESRFYPEDEQPLRRLVDSTYQLPVDYVTEVSWIRKHLLDRYAKDARVVRNGIRKDLYFPDSSSLHKSSDSKGFRVLVEGPFRVKFKNVGKTIQLVKRAKVRDITLLTSSPVTWVPGINRVYSRVPITMAPAIYQSCDLLVKLSTVEGMFGPPLEMFHCGGTAVVYNVSGHDEYIEHGFNALVAEMGNENAVVDYIGQLANDRGLLAELKRNALATADAWPSWEQSSSEFHDWIEFALTQPRSDREQIAAHVAAAWRDYMEAEEARLKVMPKSLLKNKLHSLVRSLPPAAVKLIENSMAIYETVH
jgi:glycosyltransferase involved in cell wall biosynthesis